LVIERFAVGVTVRFAVLLGKPAAGVWVVVTPEVVFDARPRSCSSPRRSRCSCR
jgi:hypothetical protein